MVFWIDKSFDLVWKMQCSTQLLSNGNCKKLYHLTISNSINRLFSLSSEKSLVLLFKNGVNIGAHNTHFPPFVSIEEQQAC
ncbi:hypothetical protein BDA96_02G127000 [Sorghum bicolor]|uniref:Uncharacterized protein n=2 Tax=Sorghum bicolor TaxID=4558 RepID=A0A921RLM0_SORBI|nr:hypothetical protein BDA96_02G127000 [Sorghum bicolor]OQU88915.1 hypothetical protein SORBI_3002G121050 [Sorghum bicolor]